MIKIVEVKKSNDPEVRKVTCRDISPTPAVRKTVEAVLRKVRSGGHKAVLNYARRFDGLKGNLKVGAGEITAAASKCDLDFQFAARKPLEDLTVSLRCLLYNLWR